MLERFLDTYEEKFDSGKKRAVLILKEDLQLKGTRTMLEVELLHLIGRLVKL
jgi:hypothetical protein